MKKNFILEIGTEEIPARFCAGILNDLKEIAQKELTASNLKFEKLETSGTCRRLVLWIENLAASQPNIEEEIKGPPKQVAFDTKGKPMPPAIGFAKTQNIPLSQLYARVLDGREYLFAKIKKIGQKTEKILPEILTKILNKLYLPISMSWGSGDHKFIRPVHWILALFGEKIIPFEWAGQKAGKITFGHFFLNPRAQKIDSPEKYFAAVEKNGVIIDPEKRKKNIMKLLERAGAEIPLDLLEETVFLVEKPEAVVGEFEKKFLALPAPILKLAMEKYQKYFPVKEKNQFVVIVDGLPEGELKKIKIKNIRGGNEKVLTARLTDARFFYEHDLKIPIADNLEKLKGILLYKNLGNMYDKVERVGQLVGYLLEASRLKGTACEKILAESLRLFKNDLVSLLVGEIDSLGGIAGGLYAQAQGYPKEVALAIEEHYLPRFAGDLLPKTQAGEILAMADKVDTLVTFLAAGYEPSGSSDPFGLRRLALGIILIATSAASSLNFGQLENLVEVAYEILKAQAQEPVRRIKLSEKISRAKLFAALGEFIFQRLRQNLIQEKFRYDLVEAVLAGGLKIPLRNLKNIRLLLDSLSKAAKEDWFKKFVETAVRVKRLGASGKTAEVNEEIFREKSEAVLWDVCRKIKPNFAASASAGNWSEAIFELKQLIKPVDQFFIDVLVMDKDETLRANRLALLLQIDGLFRQMADFEKVVIS